MNEQTNHLERLFHKWRLDTELPPACVLSHCSRVGLFATPPTIARQAPLSVGSSKQGYCSGVPRLAELPRGPSNQTFWATELEESLMWAPSSPCLLPSQYPYTSLHQVLHPLVGASRGPGGRAACLCRSHVEK